jgi:hypothetical protein
LWSVDHWGSLPNQHLSMLVGCYSLFNADVDREKLYA